MKAAELLGCEVYDSDGQAVGHVHDLLFRYVAPQTEHEPPRFELTGLECGKSGIGRRLGYTRGTMAGPRLLWALFRWLDRHSVTVDWRDVESFDCPRVLLRKPWNLLRRADYLPPSDGFRR